VTESKVRLQFLNSARKALGSDKEGNEQPKGYQDKGKNGERDQEIHG
jgi:hypothetical protein